MFRDPGKFDTRTPCRPAGAQPASSPKGFKLAIAAITAAHSAMASRLLLPSAIPAELWKDGTLLQLCPDLAGSYRSVLQTMGLLEEALAATAQGDIGGEGAKETTEHFTRNFSGSCGRVQLALLDPKDCLGEASNHFVRTFSGGKVALLDIPSGSGAGSVVILSTLARLRKASALPREPLYVWLVAGDKSQSALDNTARMLEALRPHLERQAIFVQLKCVAWDMLSAASTAKLIYAWTKEHAPHDCREFFALTANCSGFLQHEGNFKKAEAQLEQIMTWCGQLKSTFIWVEPGTHAATQRMIPRIAARLWTNVLEFFGYASGASMPPPLQCAADLAHPIKPNFVHRVTLTLLRLERHAP